MSEFDTESMMEVFTFEMTQQLQQLEQNIIQGDTGYTDDKINEIFRIMHTIKGSAAMMMFNNISVSAHAIEDLFFYLREEKPDDVDYSAITDLVLNSADFIKEELAKIEAGLPSDGDDSENIMKIKDYLKKIKRTGNMQAESAEEQTGNTAGSLPLDIEGANSFQVILKFEDGCEMENVRAFAVVHNLKDKVLSCSTVPQDLIDESSADIIKKAGLIMNIVTAMPSDELYGILSGTIFLKELLVSEVEKPHMHAAALDATGAHAEAKPSGSPATIGAKAVQAPNDQSNAVKKATGQSMISVNVNKLDDLLKLMGELVISEAMVTQNPELDGLQLDGFYKEARQLEQIIKDMQSTIMSLRMIPLSTTFFKMHRIVRDMCRQLNKDIHLEIIGEETEVDKNIIEHISDPIMHIIRNSADHGIETREERKSTGKPERGTIVLEALSSGSDVLIKISDDGAGLDREKILEKAKENGLLTKPESDYTDKEIYQFILMPGFSTNDSVTEYSGRGVGMDVVSKNIDHVNGTVLIDSTPGEGSMFTLKIPLTLAIIDGMLVKMGGSKYTIPILCIKDSFKPSEKDIFKDPNGNEMITVRGEVYNIVRLYEFFNAVPEHTDPTEGILIMLENGNQMLCLLVDDIVGQQQVVLKNMPKYIKKIKGVSGCTLLGNGDISLILDVPGFFDS